MIRNFSLNNTRKIESLNIPKQYKITLIEFFYKLENIFGDNLSLFVVTGSGGREKIIDGWSDLDVLIVLKDFSPEQDINLAKLVENQPVKVGITVYSKQEFENGLVDSKTIFNLELIRERILLPIILEKGIRLPYFSVAYRKSLHRELLPNLIHELRRSLYYPDKLNIHSIAKNIDTIMKFILSINQGVLISGYREVQEEFYKQFQNCPKVYNVFELLEKKDVKGYYQQCWDFLVYITTKEIIDKYFEFPTR